MGSEVDLARHVVAWFKDEGWEVYEEVSLGHASAIDLVAVRRPVVAAVEVKTTFSVALLGQAKRWVGKAHQTYVAVPEHKSTAAHEGAVWLCKTLGLGLLSVSARGFVRDVVRPEFRRKVDSQFILGHLRDQQQDGSIPAGTATGARWTPWRVTIQELTEHVGKNPGVTLKEALTKIKHHYRGDKSARAAISDQIRSGIIKTIRAEGRELRLYLLRGSSDCPEDPPIAPS